MYKGCDVCILVVFLRAFLMILTREERERKKQYNYFYDNRLTLVVS